MALKLVLQERIAPVDDLRVRLGKEIIPKPKGQRWPGLGRSAPGLARPQGAALATFAASVGCSITSHSMANSLHRTRLRRSKKS